MITRSHVVVVLLLSAVACSRNAPPALPPVPANEAPPVEAATAAEDSTAASLSRNAIVDRALAIFGDVSMPEGGVATDDAEPSWDIDVESYETHERVAHYIDVFTGRGRESFINWLVRGTRYEPMIRDIFREQGIPEDMYYLGLVESGYDADAYSRAAAVGMWQFMTATARSVGLRVDWWVDDRRDPVRATRAAARYLTDLRDQFGSLYLAAAAYNGGPGRVSRGLTRFADDMEGLDGEDRFFALAEHDYLRAETRNYVPQLVAAALIAKEPDRFGVSFNALPPFAYDSVQVPGGTPLAAAARAVEIPVDSLVELNRRVLRGVTPPGDSFELRLPSGLAVKFDSAFAALPDSVRHGFTTVKSKKGQTAASLAKAHGISSRLLGQYNPGLSKLRNGQLRAGQSVLIPTAATLLAARDVPDPSIERYGTSARVHVVKRGENLSVIARKYHTTVRALKRANGLTKSTIYPGQRLRIS